MRHCIANYFAVYLEENLDKVLDKLHTGFCMNLQKCRQFSACSTEKIIEEDYDYINMKRGNNDTADMFLYAWGLHFQKFHVKHKQQWGPLVLLIKRKRVEKLYPEVAPLNISLYWVLFKTENFEVLEPKFSPIKVFYKQNLENNCWYWN